VALTSRLGPLAVASALLALAGCARSDPRLEKLSEGIALDSVLRVMEADSATRTDAFLMNGRMINALYFARPGATDSADRTDRKMSPVVLVDGKVVGWGWEKWDSIAAANAITVVPADKK